MSTDRGKNKEVHVLYVKDEDGYQEIIGIYDSEKALICGFAQTIAEGRLSRLKISSGGQIDSEVASNAMRELARDVAILVTRLVGSDYAGEDECRYGDAIYGWESHLVCGIDYFNTNENNEDEKVED